MTRGRRGAARGQRRAFPRAAGAARRGDAFTQRLCLGFRPDATAEDWRLLRGHECVTHHAHYRFPLEVLLSGAGGAAAARAAFLRHTGGGTRTIFSAYGSPYACHIPAASVRAAAAPGGGDEVTVRAVGEAVRDRAAPTMAQAHAAHADAAREMAAAAAVRGSGVRVVKAHWASGACRHCAQPLEPGCLIGAHEPRGWSHVLCLAGGREGAMPSAAPPPPPTLRKRGRVTSAATLKRRRQRRSAAAATAGA